MRKEACNVVGVPEFEKNSVIRTLRFRSGVAKVKYPERNMTEKVSPGVYRKMLFRPEEGLVCNL